MNLKKTIKIMMYIALVHVSLLYLLNEEEIKIIMMVCITLIKLNRSFERHHAFLLMNSFDSAHELNMLATE